MAGENSGDTVNIISVGVDTAEALTKIKQLERAISSSAGRIASLEKQGLGNSAEANKRRATIQQQRQDLLALEAGFKKLSDTQKAALAVEEKFAESRSRGSKVTASYRATVDGVNLSYREGVKASSDLVKSISLENAARAKQLSLGNDTLALMRRATAEARTSAKESMAMYAPMAKLREDFLRALEAGNKLNLAGQRAAEWKQVQQAERMAMLNIEGERQQHLARLRAQEAGNKLNLAGQRAAEWSKLRSEMAGVYALTTKAADGYNAFGKSIVGATALANRFGEAQAKAFLGPRSYLLGLSGELDNHRAKLKGATDSTARHSSATHAAALAHDALHSAARGVSGVMGGLWLTYARMLPVLIATAGATKALKDSFSGGLDTTFQSQFIASVDTGGKVQGDALRSLRNDILTSLIEVGRDSVFTVEQNADALKKLSLAGIEASRGINLLGTASNAAIFAQEDLGKTTEMILDTLYNFNLASMDAGKMADNFERVANVMSYTAITVNAGFADIAKSFQNIVGVAGTFGIEIEEASAILQNLAKSGIRGQKAGTYVRNFLDDFLGAPISQRAEKRLSELNIERFDPGKFGTYGVSQYIDEVVKKIADLDFVEQQSTIRAITNQRSRRVLRQEIIASYQQEGTLLERVVTLAEKAEGSLANMAEGLKDNAKMSLQYAQAAYNASVIEAYQGAGTDLALADIGKQLQNIFNSEEFKSFLKSAVTFATDALKSLTKLFEYLIDSQSTIKSAISVAFDSALILGFVSAVGKAVHAVQSFIPVAAGAAAAMQGKTVAAGLGAAAGAGLGAASAVVGSGILLIKHFEDKKWDHAGKSVSQLEDELKGLEARMKSVAAQAQDDSTGFYANELSELEGRVKGTRKALEDFRREEERSLAVLRGQKVSAQWQEAANQFIEQYNRMTAAIRTGGLDRETFDFLNFTNAEKTIKGLKEIEAQAGKIIDSLRTRQKDLTLQLSVSGLSDADKERLQSELRGVTNELQVAQEQFGKVAQAIDTAMDASARAVEGVIKFNAQLTKLGITSLSIVKEKTVELKKAFSDAILQGDALAAYQEAASRRQAEAARASAETYSQLAAQAGNDEQRSFFLRVAESAQQAATSFDGLGDSTRDLADVQAYLADKASLSSAALAQMDSPTLDAQSVALEKMAKALSQTAEARLKDTLATLEQARAQAELSGDDARVASINRYISALNGLAAAQKAAAEQRSNEGRGRRGERDAIRSQLEEARTAIQDFKNSYSEMLSSIQDSTKDLAIGPLEAYERSMRAAAEAYDQMFAAIYKAKNTSGLSANDRQKLQTDELKLLGEANKETRRLLEEYHDILEDRSKNLEELEIATGRKVLGAAESWLREYANKYGETVTLLQSDITNLETKLKVAVDTGQSDEEVARLTAALKVLKDQLVSFSRSATLGAWAADIEESIGIAEKTLESFSQTLDRMADKSSKEGLFGILSGNAAAFEATKAKYVRGLQESISEIKRKIWEAGQQGDFKLKAELEIRLGNLEGSLQEASERIDPILEGWGDSLGDYIANGIVYGFDQGESPAKAFANMLRHEIYKSIASALSKQFTLSLNNIFGGGGIGTDFLTSAFNAVFSRPGSGAAAAGVSPAGVGSSGVLSGVNPLSMLGGNSIGMGFSNAATWLAQSNLLAGTGVGNYLTGFAGNAAGMSNLALGGAGLLGGIGANLLFGGKGYSSAGGSLGSTVGMIAGGPIGAAIGGLLGGAIGSLFGGGKPSDKTAWATVNPTSGALSGIGSMTGKKDPGQEARDNTKSLAEFIGGFAGLAGISSSITAMTGGRDGLRLKINRSEGRLGFRTPGAGVASGGNSLNYGYGDEAIRKMLDDLVDEGTLPRSVIDSWRAMKTDMVGVSRDATELVSTLNLLVQGYDRASIERANLLQKEGEALESAMGRMISIENALKGATLPGTELANNAGAMVAQLKKLSLSAIPTSVEQFRALIDGLDLTAAGGREAYVSLMNLAPAFIEIQKAQETLYSQLLTDDEKTSRAAKALSTAFRELGVSMPESRDELRSMIDAQDQTTQSGATLRAQLLGLVPAFLEAGAAVERATGAAREAAEEAARTARQMAEQEVAAARRAADTAGTAARNMATQNLSNAQSASNEARSTAEDSARRAVQLAENELSAALASADQYKTLRKDLVSGTFSPLSEMEVAEWSGNNYRDTLSRARGGDSQALSDLPGAARSFLESKMQTATSAEDYIRAYAGVQANAAELEGSALNDVELARAQLESVKSQTGVLIDIKDEITTVAEALSVFGADYIKYVDSQGAVSTAQSELDRVNSVISSLVPDSGQFNSVDEALAAFNTAFSDLTSAEGLLETVNKETSVLLPLEEGVTSAADALEVFREKLLAYNALTAELTSEPMPEPPPPVPTLQPTPEPTPTGPTQEQPKAKWPWEATGLLARLLANRNLETGRPGVNDTSSTIDPDQWAARLQHYKEKIKSGGMSSGRILSLTDYLSARGEYAGARFASGGTHTGGIRLVGERGPELEVTGPSRIWSYEQTRRMLSGGGENGQLLVELAALRTEVAQLRAATEATAMNTHEFKKQISRWDQEGMPEVRETV